MCSVPTCRLGLGSGPIDAAGTLVEAGVAVARLVMVNERLSQEVRAQLAEVSGSRARIVEAGEVVSVWIFHCADGAASESVK